MKDLIKCYPTSWPLGYGNCRDRYFNIQMTMVQFFTNETTNYQPWKHSYRYFLYLNLSPGLS